MLLNQKTLRAIAEGRVTLAFRCWRRPTVKTGGSLLTPVGVLSIDSVDEVEVVHVTESEAAAAGYASLSELKQELANRDGDTVYRIRFRLSGPDPRSALREQLPDSEEIARIRRRLERWDKASKHGKWTCRVLQVIRDRPEARAADLAQIVGLDRDRFKVNVRKLKGIGLTESLKVGYRLSPRGVVVLRDLEKHC